MEKQELESYALGVLERAGIRIGLIVLDFGCGRGAYTIPAARIVGSAGKVYALDKDKEALDELMNRAESESLDNVERIRTGDGLQINIADECVDVVLLFHVLHSYYFPEASERRILLDEIHRVLRTDGFLSVYPKDLESETTSEIERAGFYGASTCSGIPIYESPDFDRDQVLQFRKAPVCSLAMVIVSNCINSRSYCGQEKQQLNMLRCQ